MFPGHREKVMDVDFDMVIGLRMVQVLVNTGGIGFRCKVDIKKGIGLRCMENLTKGNQENFEEGIGLCTSSGIACWVTMEEIYTREAFNVMDILKGIGLRCTVDIEKDIGLCRVFASPRWNIFYIKGIFEEERMVILWNGS